MNNNITERPFTVVLTGPESTGKTTLARELAGRLQGQWVPEYAREYVKALGRPYTYEDVVHIYKHQLTIPEDPQWRETSFLFLDTDLVILKIWFLEVFGKMPEEMDRILRNRKIDLYLLCRPDIPWVYDPLRENPGTRREELFVLYERELQTAGMPYEIIGGAGEERLEKALTVVREHYVKGE